MTEQKSEQGSAHVAMISLMVVVVIAALVVVFWQNFTNNSAANNSSRVQNSEDNRDLSQQISLKTVKIDEDFGTQLSFKYLDEWQLERSIDGDKTDMWTEDFQITSPSGKYVVTYKIGSGGGLGGACDESTAGVINEYSYEVLPEFSEMSFVTYSINSSSPQSGDETIGMFQPESIGILMNTSKAMLIQSGESACKLYFAKVLLLKEGDPAASQSPVHLLDATIKDTNVDAATDIDESILEGEYQVAKGVLFSTTH